MRRLLTTAILLLGALPCLFADGKPAVELQAFSPAEVKPGNAAQYTIISKATSVEEDREALNAAILEPIFAPSKRKKTT